MKINVGNVGEDNDLELGWGEKEGEMEGWERVEQWGRGGEWVVVGGKLEFTGFGKSSTDVFLIYFL